MATLPAGVFNPYSFREPDNIAAIPEYAAMQSRYAAPGLEEGDAYNDEFGWAPKSYRADPSRVGNLPRIDYRPEPTRPAEEFWNEKLGRDKAERHSVETQDADGMTELKGRKRWAPNPRSTPPPEDRKTMALSPHSYSFTRPMTGGAARFLNGRHFSMADHRRTYEILGMKPVTSRRNTYRTEPGPWDADIVDMAVKKDSGFNAILQSPDLPGPSRNYRLGE